MWDESRCKAEKEIQHTKLTTHTADSRYSHLSHKVTFVCVHELEQSHRLMTI